MKIGLFKGKSTRTKIFTAITLLAVVLLLAGNLILTYFGSQSLIFADMTPEGFYTLTDKMIETCDTILEREEVKAEGVKITFCTDPDYLVASLDLRYTYYLALSLRNRYDSVEVETVNVAINPTAVAKYKTTSRDQIKTSDVIFSYGGKYRVVSAQSLWTSNYYSYNGEYKVASILASLTAINRPKAYFVTDHGETYYDPATPDSAMSLKTAYLADLLVERGLEIKTVKISEVERIPEDCALLIINDPKTDFVADPSLFDRFDYVSDTEKLDRYLVAHQGAIVVNKGYDISLPNLESFLLEWGIGFGDGYVKDAENCLPDVGEEGSTILGVYDENTLGGAYYESYSNLASAPKMVFTDTGFVYNAFKDSDVVGETGGYSAQKTYSDFIYTSPGAIGYEKPGSTVITDSESKKALAAITTRTDLDSYTGETTYSYLFASNSSAFFSNELLGNPSYANYDVMAAMIDNISRTDRYVSIELGGTSPNSTSRGGKQTLTTTIQDKENKVTFGNNEVKVNKGLKTDDKVVFTVIIMAVPVAVIIAGVAVFLRRKFL